MPIDLSTTSRDDNGILSPWTWSPELVGRACEPITEFDDDLRKIAEDMFKSVFAYRGVAIAAPQLGIFRQLTTICIPAGYLKASKDLKLVVCNAEIKRYGKQQQVFKLEGCLSLPGMRGNTTRSTEIDVLYQDEYGESHFKTLKGYMAQVFQHEIDHLSGIFFVDRCSHMQKKLILKKHKKLTALAIKRGAEDVKI